MTSSFRFFGGIAFTARRGRAPFEPAPFRLEVFGKHKLRDASGVACAREGCARGGGLIFSLNIHTGVMHPVKRTMPVAVAARNHPRSAHTVGIYRLVHFIDLRRWVGDHHKK